MIQTSKSPQDRKLEGEPVVTTMTIFDSVEENLHYPGVMDVSPEELSQRLGSVFLVDVRQGEEFKGDLGHIPGAHLIVLDTLEENLDKLPKNQTIVFVCRSGGRSARASMIATENGFKNVYNLKGGMILWNDLHLETEI